MENVKQRLGVSLLEIIHCIAQIIFELHNFYLFPVQQVLRTDIVMDVGISLNPAIDIGQVSKSFYFSI